MTVWLPGCHCFVANFWAALPPPSLPFSNVILRCSQVALLGKNGSVQKNRTSDWKRLFEGPTCSCKTHRALVSNIKVVTSKNAFGILIWRTLKFLQNEPRGFPTSKWSLRKTFSDLLFEGPTCSSKMRRARVSHVKVLASKNAFRLLIWSPYIFARKP